MEKTEKLWEKFETQFRKIQTAHGIEGLVSWDMETMMPSGAVEQRISQLSYLQTHLHELVTDDAYLDNLRALNEVSEELGPARASAVAWQQRQALLKKKIPAALVRESSEAESRAFESWRKARAAKDFSLFETPLTGIIRIRREIARCIQDSGQSEYEALLGLFEPQAPVARIEELLAGVKRDLVPLIPRILEKQKREWPAAVALSMPIEEQQQMSRWVLEQMGFDFQHGRLDVAAHPFCGGAGMDIRLTTRYDEQNWFGSFYATMHEGGHALYELGMERLVSHKALREAPSHAAHESQSRFWENFIGRSVAFCEWLAEARKIQVPGLSQHANRVKPSFIRVEADEATYNLHILLRFELETAIFRDEIHVQDLPEAWNTKMRDYLGITPPDASLGILQDVHWSRGAFGYFPTYTLGNLIAAQLHARIGQELDLNRLIHEGKLHEIRDWLNAKFHAHGCGMKTLDLVRSVTGQELSHEPFIGYLKAKFLG